MLASDASLTSDLDQGQNWPVLVGSIRDSLLTQFTSTVLGINRVLSLSSFSSLQFDLVTFPSISRFYRILKERRKEQFEMETRNHTSYFPSSAQKTVLISIAICREKNRRDATEKEPQREYGIDRASPAFNFTIFFLIVRPWIYKLRGGGRHVLLL